MTEPADPDPTLEDPAVLREYYRQMALIRAFELRAAEMYTRARIGGYCHLNLGEEATVAGLTAALRDGDYLFATYREHGYALVALGARPEVVALDGEVGNSTYAGQFAAAYPDRFSEMFIAEQQLIAAAVGLAVRGIAAAAGDLLKD